MKRRYSRDDDGPTVYPRGFFQAPAVCRHDVTWVPGLLEKPRDMTCYCERCGVEMSHDGLEVLATGGAAPADMLPALQELHRLRRLVHSIMLESQPRLEGSDDIPPAERLAIIHAEIEQHARGKR